MPFYQSQEMLYRVMDELFNRTLADREAAAMAEASNIVVRLITTEPDAILTADGRARPARLFTGSTAHPPDLVLRLSADLLHAIWLGQADLQQALFSGQLRAEGAIMRALGLLDLFQAVADRYPQVLKDAGLLGPE